MAGEQFCGGVYRFMTGFFPHKGLTSMHTSKKITYPSKMASKAITRKRLKVTSVQSLRKYTNLHSSRLNMDNNCAHKADGCE